MSLEWAVSHRHEYDITTTYKLNEPGELVFKILTKDNVNAYKIGQIVEYDDKVFIVDKLDIDRDDYSITTVTCQQNAINLSKKICGAYEFVAETVQTLANEVLKGSGWSLGRTDIPSSMKRHLISEEETVLANLNTIAENFGAVLIFNYNTVDILMQKGSELILSDESNLSTINITKDGGNIITRLHCFGGVDKETGIETSILDQTNGLTYVEDYSFFLEQGFSLSFIQSRPDLFLREAVYRNTDLLDSQALYNAGVTQLEAQMYPEVTCQVKVVDNGTPIELNMAATIYDSETETHLSARVTEVSINKDNPAEIEVELSNTVSYGSWVSDVITKVDRIDSVINETNKNWQEIIEAAKKEATDILDKGMEDSHVIVRKNAIIIGDAENFDDMTRYWLWNKNGLGHINKNDGEGGLVNTAMTMDGAIVADRITVGELNGAIISAGTVSADALEVQAYEKIQQGINIGATNYIRNSGNFTDSKYWLGNVTYKETLLQCNGEVRNVSNIYLMGGEEYIYSATIITETDMEITEDNLILGYTAYQPLGTPQTRDLSAEELAKVDPIITTKARTYEALQGSNVLVSFESSKTLSSLKLSINNGEDFNYEGTISGQNATFKLAHLTYGNYTCQLVGEDANGNKGYSKTFIISIATTRKNSVIFSNIGIAEPHLIKANTLTRIFLKYKAREDLSNGFIINPTLNINGNYKIKNVQWEKGNVASDWKDNILDISEGTLNEARTIFSVENGKILGRVEEIEKNYVSSGDIDGAIGDALEGITTDLGDVSDRLGTLEEDFSNISFDGIIDEVEAKLIAENITQLNKEKADVDTRFNNLYNSILLTGDAKTKLNEAKNFFDLKHTALLNKINQIIEDGLLTDSEMLEFKSCIQQYQNALGLLSKAFDDAIANVAENVANNYTNEKFAEVKVELDKISLSVGNTITQLADYKKTTDEKISKIEMTSNNINMSVSDIKESVNLMGSVSSEQQNLQNQLNNINNKTNQIKNEIEGALADGILDEAEKTMLRQKITDLNTEKKEVVAETDALLNNASLTDNTIKQTLNTSKNSFITAHTNLVNKINSIISSGKARTTDNGIVYASNTSVTGVSLNKLSTYLSVGGTETLTATISPSTASNQSVTWNSTNANVATISSRGVITAKAVGNTTITVTTSDGSKVSTCYVVVVSNSSTTVEGVTLNKDSTSLVVGKTETLTANVLPVTATNRSVNWTSSMPSIATVSSTGLITAKSPGVTTITVETKDGNKYANCKVTVTSTSTTNTAPTVTNISVTEANQHGSYKISYTVNDAQNNPMTVQLKIGANPYNIIGSDIPNGSTYYAGSGLGEGTYTCYLQVSDGSLTTTSSSFTLTIPGSTSNSLDSYFDSYSTTLQSLKVAMQSAINNISKSHAIAEVGDVSSALGDLKDTLNGAYVDGILDEAEKIILKQKITDLEKEKKEAIAEVDVLLNNKNLADTSAKSELNNCRNNFITAHTSLVNKINTVIATTSNINSITTSKIETYAITLSVTSYTLSSDGILTVNYANPDSEYVTSSTITIDSARTYATTATSTSSTFNLSHLSNGTYSGALAISTLFNKYSFTITINKGVVSNPTISVTSVSLNKSSTSINVGGTETLIATVYPTTATNRSVTWSSGSTSIATVDSNGKITGVKAGSTTITVTTNDGSKTAKCTVTVTASTISVSSVSLNKASTSLTVGATETLVATISPTNATNKNVTWSSSSSSIASVSTTGVVTAKAVGNTTITVTTSDGSKTAKCTVTVTSAPVTNTAPTISGISVSNTTQYGSYKISYTVNDAQSDKMTVSLKIGTNAYVSIATSLSNGATSYSGSGLSAGTYTCYLQVSDGKLTTTSSSFTITIPQAVTTDLNSYFSAYSTALEALKAAVQNAIDTASKSYVDKQVGDVSGALGDFKTTVEGTFKDGIINEAEKVALEKQINLLNVEKTDIDNMYTTLYSNSNLIDPAKSNLYTAKNAYNTRHSSLISIIRNAISDNKITSSEQTAVDDAFLAYATALSNYSIRHNEALNAISMNFTTSSISSLNITSDGIVATVTQSTKYQDDVLSAKKNLIIGGNFKLKCFDVWDNEKKNNMNFYEHSDGNVGIRVNNYLLEGWMVSNYINVKALKSNIVSLACKMVVESNVKSSEIYAQYYSSSKSLLKEVLLCSAASGFNGIIKSENITIPSNAYYMTIRVDHNGCYSSSTLNNVLYIDFVNLTEGKEAIQVVMADDGIVERELSSKITQTASEISSKVSKGEIISVINQTADEVKISASKIELDGNTLLNGQMKMLPSSGSTNYASLYALRNGNGVNMRVQLGGTQQDGQFEVVSGSTAKYFWVNYSGTHSSNYHFFHTDASSVGYNNDCVWDNGTFRPTVNDKGQLGHGSYYWNQSWINNMYCNTLTAWESVEFRRDVNLTGGDLVAKNNSIHANYIGSYGNIFATSTVKGNYLHSTGSALIEKGLQVNDTATIKSTVYIGGSLEVKSYGTTLKELTTNGTTTFNAYTLVKENSLGVEKNIYCNGNIEALKAGYGQINANYLGSMGNIACRYNLSVGGSKNCVQSTESFGQRLINAYETAEYYFGDIGESVVENGECIVMIDDIFKETISTEYEYQVFITKYGRGDVWVSERNQDYFVVQADNDIKFGWEIKGKRKGYEAHRLEEYVDEGVVTNG